MTDLLGLSTDNLDTVRDDTLVALDEGISQESDSVCEGHLHYNTVDILHSKDGQKLEKILESFVHHDNVLKDLYMLGNPPMFMCYMVIDLYDEGIIKDFLHYNEVPIRMMELYPGASNDLSEVGLFVMPTTVATECPIKLLLNKLGA